MKNKIKFGMVGCGNIAQKALIPALQTSQMAELTAIASRSGNGDSKKLYIDYFDLLDNPKVDAVYISLPPALHSEMIMAAAIRGKHVLCEKPLCVTLDEVKKSCACCEENGVALMEGLMYQFHPQHEIVRQIVRRGEIGSPRCFQAWFGIPSLPRYNFRYRKLLGGGALLDLGSYVVHAARKFFGREPEKTFSVLDFGEEVDESGSVLLDFGLGQTAQLTFGFGHSYKNIYSVWGSRGFLTLERAFSVPSDYASKIIVSTQSGQREQIIEPCDHFSKELTAFCNIIRHEEKRIRWREDAIKQSEVLRGAK